MIIYPPLSPVDFFGKADRQVSDISALIKLNFSTLHKSYQNIIKKEKFEKITNKVFCCKKHIVGNNGFHCLKDIPDMLCALTVYSAFCLYQSTTHFLIVWLFCLNFYFVQTIVFHLWSNVKVLFAHSTLHKKIILVYEDKHPQIFLGKSFLWTKVSQIGFEICPKKGAQYKTSFIIVDTENSWELWEPKNRYFIIVNDIKISVTLIYSVPYKQLIPNCFSSYFWKEKLPSNIYKYGKYTIHPRF